MLHAWHVHVLLHLDVDDDTFFCLSYMMVPVDRSEGLDDDGDLDRVSELRSLPGSRKTSEQMRKLSGKSFLFLIDHS